MTAPRRTACGDQSAAVVAALAGWLDRSDAAASWGDARRKTGKPEGPESGP